MQCYVYRSRRKLQTYLILPDRDNFDPIPASLKKLFGEPEFSFEFDLSTQQKLAQVDPEEVARNLRENGFYLQLPPGDAYLYAH